MNNSKSDIIQEELEKTMHLLDAQKKQSADSFFYTRLKGRMEDLGISYSRPSWILSTLQISAIACILLVNVYTVSAHSRTEGDEKISREQMLKHTVEEYHIFPEYNSLIKQ